MLEVVTSDEILRVLEEHAPEALSPTEVSQELPERQLNTVRKTLLRMADDGLVEQTAYGQYRVTKR